MRPSLIAISCLFLLTACGQKGPLFLPQSATPTQQEVEPRNTPATTEAERKDKAETDDIDE